MKLIEQYVIALTNLYGVVKMDTVIEIYNEHTGEEIEVKDLKKISEKNLENNFVITAVDFYFEDYMDDHDIGEMIRSHMNKDFYVPEQVELLKYIDNDYYEKTIHHNNFINFVKKHIFIFESDAEIFTDDLMIDVVTGDFSMQQMFDIIDLSGAVLDEEKLEEFVNLTMHMVNNTRVPFNLGHTPLELMPTEHPKKEKKLLN